MSVFLGSRQRELLRAYPAVVAFLRARLPRGQREEAGDLAHDAVLGAYAAMRGVNASPIENLESYVLGIARHKLEDWLRGRGRHREDRVPIEALDGFGERLRVAAAERAVLERERTERLHRALAALSDVERDLLWLRYRDGASHGDACRAVGVSSRRGSHLKHRALEKLRFRLRALDSRGRRAPRRPSVA